MCLAIPSKIISFSEDRKTAIAECMGVTKSVSLEMLDSDVSVGDHVLVHVGFAIRKVNMESAKKTLADHLEMAKLAIDFTHNE